MTLQLCVGSIRATPMVHHQHALFVRTDPTATLAPTPSLLRALPSRMLPQSRVPTAPTLSPTLQSMATTWHSHTVPSPLSPLQSLRLEGVDRADVFAPSLKGALDPQGVAPGHYIRP